MKVQNHPGYQVEPENLPGTSRQFLKPWKSPKEVQYQREPSLGHQQEVQASRKQDADNGQE